MDLQKTSTPEGVFTYIDMLEDVIEVTMTKISTASVRSHLLPRIIDEMDIDTMTETVCDWPIPGSVADMERRQMIEEDHEEALLIDELWDFDPKFARRPIPRGVCVYCGDPRCRTPNVP